MKISKNKLRAIIKEEFEALLEYEQYVDEDGNVYDDEGNVSRRGREFGRRYGGGTYGLRGLPSGGGYRSRSRQGSTPPNSQKLAAQISAVKTAIETKPSNFLNSILDQLNRGRRLSSKQNAIVKKIVMKSDPDAANLFESHNEKLRITFHNNLFDN